MYAMFCFRWFEHGFLDFEQVFRFCFIDSILEINTQQDFS